MSQFIEMFGTSESNEKGWKICSFGEKFSITSGGTPNTQIEEYWNGNISWIGSNCCQNCILTENDGKYITEEGFNHCSAKMYKPDTILVALVGATIGKVAYLKFDTCTNQNVAGIEIKNRTEFEPMFIYYLLQNMYQRFFMLGMGKFKMASLGFIKSLPLMIPPMELQQRFVSIAEQADKSGFVGVKSQFIEMFGERTTTPVGRYIKDSFPGDWGKEDLEGNGVKVIRTTNFTNSGKLNLSEVVTRSIEERKVQKKQIHMYDTILERSGGTTENPVGRVVLFEEDGLYLCNNFTQILRFKDIDPRFAFYALFYFYQTNKTTIRSMGSKTTGIQNLNMSKYLEIGIPNAAEVEQKHFVSIAEQADKSGYYN